MRYWLAQATINTLLLLVFLAVIPFPEASGSDLTIRLAAREDRPPYVRDKAQSGIEIDIIKALAVHMKRAPVFVQLPRTRSVHMFNAKKVDGILAQNPSSTITGCASKPYISHTNVGFSIQDRGLQIGTLEDLKQYSVISFLGAKTQLGSHYKEIMDTHYHYMETRDQQAHISLLHEQRIDVVVGDSLSLLLVHKTLSSHTREHKTLAIHNIMPPTEYVARFHDPELCTSFNSALRLLRQSGDYARIFAHYKVSDPASEPTGS